MKKEEVVNDILKGFKVPSERSNEEHWEAISSRIKAQAPEKPETKVFSLKRLLPLGAAACLALAALFMFPSSESVSYHSNQGEVKTIELPDGSSVELGAESSLKFTQDNEQRLIELDGEAFFDVKKGIPFIITSDEVQVTVLGTSFNVKAREGDFDVKCFTGKVNVKAAELDVNLTKDLGVNDYDQNKIYNHASSDKVTDDGKLNFDHQHLNSVLTDLEVYRGIKITNTSELNPMISIELKSESTEEICQIISTISNLKLKKVGDSSFELY